MFAIGFVLFVLSYLFSLFLDDDIEEEISAHETMVEICIAFFYISGICLMVSSAATLLWKYLP